ncbi:MAG: DNA helicase [Pirellulaceae bacterium]|nr:MAG: DNA helicase [Pirellulaceae bacterium]
MDGTLNEAQRRAVQTLDGPLLVLAGAGTGKTRVVTYRVAELIRRGTPASRILAVTFTNKAADEMQERVRTLLGNRRTDRPRIATFHAHALDILRRHIERLGYPRHFTIYDRSDQERIARLVLRELRLGQERLRPADLLALISFWKNRGIRPTQALELAQSDKQHLAAAAYRRYQKALKTHAAVDFDDLLLCTLELFENFPEVRRIEADRFDYLLIDEYQDTNQPQYKIVRALAEKHRNLCAVGDDDQAIYGFRGADVSHILRFTRDWPDAVVIRLEENYRSTGPILTAANRLITFNSQRHPKTLRAARAGGERPRIEQFPNEEAEAAGVVADIARRLRLPGKSPRDFAILFRTNEQPRTFEAELRRARLPYVLVGSMSFFDRAEVRDVLALIRVLDAPQDDVSLLRALQSCWPGFTRTQVEKLMAEATERGAPVWEALQRAATDQPAGNLAARAAGIVGKIRQFRSWLENGRSASLTALVQEWLAEVGYRQALEHKYPDGQEAAERWGSVEQVINALAAYEQHEPDGTLSDFLNSLALQAREFDDQKEKQLRRDAIVLMTLHSAKGLEFPEVYLVGMEEGILPHRHAVEDEGRAIEEERRLCYVGITRAQDRLTLTLALTRRKWGKPRPTIPSRFLFELTGLAEHGRSAPAASAGTDRQPSRAKRSATDRRGGSSQKK